LVFEIKMGDSHVAMNLASQARLGEAKAERRWALPRKRIEDAVALAVGQAEGRLSAADAALWTAIARADEKSAIAALGAGADARLENPARKTSSPSHERVGRGEPAPNALAFAAERGMLDLVRALLKNGADPLWTCDRGGSALRSLWEGPLGRNEAGDEGFGKARAIADAIWSAAGAAQAAQWRLPLAGLWTLLEENRWRAVEWLAKRKATPDPREFAPWAGEDLEALMRGGCWQAIVAYEARSLRRFGEPTSTMGSGAHEAGRIARAELEGGVGKASAWRTRLSDQEAAEAAALAWLEGDAAGAREALDRAWRPVRCKQSLVKDALALFWDEAALRLERWGEKDAPLGGQELRFSAAELDEHAQTLGQGLRWGAALGGEPRGTARAQRMELARERFERAGALAEQDSAASRREATLRAVEAMGELLAEGGPLGGVLEARAKEELDWGLWRTAKQGALEEQAHAMAAIAQRWPASEPMLDIAIGWIEAGLWDRDEAREAWLEMASPSRGWEKKSAPPRRLLEKIAFSAKNAGWGDEARWATVGARLASSRRRAGLEIWSEAGFDPLLANEQGDCAWRAALELDDPEMAFVLAEGPGGCASRVAVDPQKMPASIFWIGQAKTAARARKKDDAVDGWRRLESLLEREALAIAALPGPAKRDAAASGASLAPAEEGEPQKRASLRI
jgi:hypothetical protein